MATELSQKLTPSSTYDKFAQYPFEKDTQFLAGLKSILQGQADLPLAEQDALIGRAKAFYFSRLSGQEVTWDGYVSFKATLKSSPTTAPVHGQDEAATRGDYDEAHSTQAEPVDAASSDEDVTWEGYLSSAAKHEGSKSTTAVPSSHPLVEATTTVHEDLSATSETPLSFQQIQELIAAGKVDEIPFNRTIPEIISHHRIADLTQGATSRNGKNPETSPFIWYFSRASLAQNQDLFHPVTMVSSGSPNRPIIFDESSDEEGGGRSAPPKTVKVPLTTDRVNEPNVSMDSAHRIKMPVPDPAPAPTQQRVVSDDDDDDSFYAAPRAKTKAPVAQRRVVSDDEEDDYAIIAAPTPPLTVSDSPPKTTMEDDAAEESIELVNIVADPYESKKSAADTQKELMNLIESSVGAEEEVDMEHAVVEGFSSEYKLLPHQVHGRLWMTERETGKKAGGILGDMGLGKTCQTICRIVDFKMAGTEHTAKEMKKWGKTTLIVCPQAVVGQWESEIKKMAPKLRVRVHHGPARTKNSADFAAYDVVITTYPLILSEFNNFQASAGSRAKDESKAADSDNDDSDGSGFVEAMKKLNTKTKGKRKAPPKKLTALFDAVFLRIVLDEAHNIKNRLGKTCKAAWELRSRYKWCLTGTPIQNNVDELFPLVHFLQIRPLNDWDLFKTQISNPIKAGRSGIPMKRLQVVLSAIMLRRKKTDIVNGKPILVLPDRTVTLVECEFEQDELDFYTAMVERTEVTLNKFAKSGASNVYTSVLVLLLRLRQACCHPELCLKNAKEDAEALDMKPKSSEQDEEQAEADELADMMAGLGVKESKCEICQGVLGPGVENKYCSDCELKVLVKARRKSTAHIDAGNIEPGELPSSAKIRKLLELLEEIKEKSNGTEKTIVFSQFTSFLDIIQKFLRKAGFKYVQCTSHDDGKMGREERDEALEKFKTSTRYNIALISFKAGSTATNALTGHKLGKKAGLGLDELLKLFDHENE
ncbi:hypothetical protein FRB98_000813 [Tulasnella sp. 332]|nr:hypothetical protein FRB98_000813 [Tulasnella sp. 332]